MHFVVFHTDDGRSPKIVGPYDHKDFALEDINNLDDIPDTDFWVEVIESYSPDHIGYVWDSLHPDE